MTVAPRRRAGCAAIDPTPAATADTTTVSPGAGFTALTAAQAVTPTADGGAADSKVMSAGLVVRIAAGETT